MHCKVEPSHQFQSQIKLRTCAAVQPLLRPSHLLLTSSFLPSFLAVVTPPAAGLLDGVNLQSKARPPWACSWGPGAGVSTTPGSERSKSLFLTSCTFFTESALAAAEGCQRLDALCPPPPLSASPGLRCGFTLGGGGESCCVRRSRRRDLTRDPGTLGRLSALPGQDFSIDRKLSAAPPGGEAERE